MGDDPQNLTDAMNNVRQQFPILAPHLDMSVAQYGNVSGSNDDRQLEFYHPDNPTNPNPGKNTLEIYNRNLKGDMLNEAIAGDMLHRVGSIDEKTGNPIDSTWYKLKQELGNSRTQKQKAIDLDAYQRDKSSPIYGNQVGSFEDWDQDSRLDAYVRGGLFPNSNPEWSDHLTPQQSIIFNKMQNYLKGKK